MSNKLMTNRQLSQLCAKGLCEWSLRNGEYVHTDFEYPRYKSDKQVDEQIIIRPFEKAAFTDADENTWYTPTEETFNALIGGDRMRHILGF